MQCWNGHSPECNLLTWWWCSDLCDWDLTSAHICCRLLMNPLWELSSLCWNGKDVVWNPTVFPVSYVFPTVLLTFFPLCCSQALPAHNHHAQGQLWPRWLHLQVWPHHFSGEGRLCRPQRPPHRPLHLRDQRPKRHRAQGERACFWSGGNVVLKCVLRYNKAGSLMWNRFKSHALC